jgi:tryptophan synthase beta chain
MIKRGYYGDFGGAFLPEILVATFDELEAVYNDARRDASFWQEYEQLMSSYSCRPTPLTFAQNLTRTISAAPGFTSSARTSTTPAPTRPTT